MRLYLDCANEECELKIGDEQFFCSARDGLAEHIFSFMEDSLKQCGKQWKDITEIVFYRGSGSFTGLRIGAAVVNALADCLQVPIFDQNHQEYKVILPDYGRPAHISQPRK